MQIARCVAPTVLLLMLGVPLAAQSSREDDILAIVDGKSITGSDVERALGQNLARLQEQIHALKARQLETAIEDQLFAQEAERRGTSVETLLRAEISSKVAPVTEADISAFYEQNRAQLPRDLDTYRSQIAAHLIGQNAAARRQAFANELRGRAKVVVLLKPPPVFRAELVVGDAPVRGPSTAPVTIVEFGDFHCPFCKNVQPVVLQILAKYGGKVRLAYKDFPLDSVHPQARAAAEAARCAGDQNKFWEFHDKLYAGAADGSTATMKRYAEEIGVGDVAAFEACVVARKHQTPVQQDAQEGAKLGVTGTPGFFINGRLLSGAQPLEAFIRVIDDELARVQ